MIKKAVLRHWMTATLLAAVLILVSVTFVEAGWCTACDAPATALAAGALYGATLAGSRFRGRTALLFSLMMAIVLAAFTAGRVLPPMATLLRATLAETGWTMHVRLNTFLSEAGRVLAVPGSNLNTSLIVFVVMLITWHAGAWLVWSTVRLRRAVAALAPAAVLLIASVSRQGSDAAFPWAFAAVAVLLLARTALVDQREQWEAGGVDYPEWIGENWGLGAAGIAALLVVIVWTATPGTWRTLREILIVRPVPVQPAAARATAGPTAVPEPVYRLEVPNMRNIGDPVPGSLSDATMMWVQLSDAPPELPGRPVVPAPPRHYWRAAVFANYNGVGWDPLPAFAGPAPQAPWPDDLPGRYRLRQTYQIEVQHDENLFSVNNPISASVEAAVRFVTPDGTAMIQGDTSQYTVMSMAALPGSGELLTAGTEYPEDIAGPYLQLPGTLPQRVRELAARLTAQAHSPYEKAARIQDYLRSTYPYRLDVARPPAGQDMVDYFLFDASGGYCSYYASAMVVMLRSVGVPARLVTGFAMGNYDLQRSAYRVPASAAHAWVEVYFPAYGWVEFEPTASQSAFIYTSRVTPTPQAPQSIEIALPIDWPALTQACLWALVIVVPFLAVWTAWRLWRRQRECRTVSGRQAQARRLYWTVRRALRNSGLHTPSSLTPGEYLAAADRPLAGRPQLLAALERVTALYIAATFSQAFPSAADLDAGRRAWRRAWLEVASLWTLSRAGRLRPPRARSAPGRRHEPRTAA